MGFYSGKLYSAKTTIWLAKWWFQHPEVWLLPNVSFLFKFPVVNLNDMFCLLVVWSMTKTLWFSFQLSFSLLFRCISEQIWPWIFVWNRSMHILCPYLRKSPLFKFPNQELKHFRFDNGFGLRRCDATINSYSDSKWARSEAIDQNSTIVSFHMILKTYKIHMVSKDEMEIN